MPRTGKKQAASSAPRNKAVANKPQAAIPRSDAGSREQQAAGGAIARVTGAIKNIFKRSAKPQAAEAAEPQPAMARPKTPSRGKNKAGDAKAMRATKRESDIPIDLLDKTYTPHSTSHKAGFRSDGADHEQDQEFAAGSADERWNDEDRLTNKSGDPRIGTHNRTYEPGEARAESRSRG